MIDLSLDDEGTIGFAGKWTVDKTMALERDSTNMILLNPQ